MVTSFKIIWQKWKKKVQGFYKKLLKLSDIESVSGHWNPQTTATPAQILKYLKQFGIKANTRFQHDNFRNTPILQAIAEGKKALALYFIKRNFAALDMSDLDRQSYNSPLLLAIKMGMTEVAMAIINKGVDVDLADAEGFYPIHWAAIWRNSKLINALIEAGADVNIGNKYDVTALQYYQYHITISDLQYNYLLDHEGRVMLDNKKNPILAPQPILPDFKQLFYHTKDVKQFLLDRPNINKAIREKFIKNGAKESDQFYLRVIKSYQDRAESLVKGINNYRAVSRFETMDVLKLEFFLIDATQDLSSKVTDLAINYAQTRMNFRKSWNKTSLGKKSKKA